MPLLISFFSRFLPAAVVVGLSFSAAAGAEPTRVASVDADLTTPVVIDTSIALRVGGIELSAYALAKNQRVFEGRTRETKGRAPTLAELASWRELFEAQQILIADAQAHGYFDRPEVSRAVAAMEEYMLTQSSGPYYTTLYASAPSADDARLQALFNLTRLLVRVEGIRFDSAEVATAALGENFSERATEEKLTTLRRAQRDPHAEYSEGELTWPCSPYSEIAERLVATKPGHWLQSSGEEGVVILYVHAVREQALPEYSERREAFAGYVKEFQRRRVYEQHRAAVLRGAEFKWNADAAVAVNERFHASLDGEGRLRDTALSEWGAHPLGRYVWAGAAVVITVSDWRLWFNAQLMRRVAQSPKEVAASVGTMVVQRFDLRAAHKARLDATPQFVEDRRNFTRNQVLDLYEREKLLPGIRVTDENVRAEYASRALQYQGRTFDEVAAAIRFELQHRLLESKERTLGKDLAQRYPIAVIAGNSADDSHLTPHPSNG